jgi:hypothetical protein
MDGWMNKEHGFAAYFGMGRNADGRISPAKRFCFVLFCVPFVLRFGVFLLLCGGAQT